jgi:hypothetical protein
MKRSQQPPEAGGGIEQICAQVVAPDVVITEKGVSDLCSTTSSGWHHGLRRLRKTDMNRGPRHQGRLW